MAASENHFAWLLNEKEVIELLENTTPGRIKKATKYGAWKLHFENLSIWVSQSKTVMQVETIYTLILKITWNIQFLLTK